MPLLPKLLLFARLIFQKSYPLHLQNTEFKAGMTCRKGYRLLDGGGGKLISIATLDIKAKNKVNTNLNLAAPSLTARVNNSFNWEGGGESRKGDSYPLNKLLTLELQAAH